MSRLTFYPFSVGKMLPPWNLNGIISVYPAESVAMPLLYLFMVLNCMILATHGKQVDAAAVPSELLCEGQCTASDNGANHLASTQTTLAERAFVPLAAGQIAPGVSRGFQFRMPHLMVGC